MAAAMNTPNGKALPSKRTLALAFAVVRSKPPELSIADYIHNLRQHIAPGRRENALSSSYRHLDRSSFWRSEFERVKSDLLEAETRNVELQREVEALRENVGTEKLAPAGAKKRKRVDEDVVLVPSNVKRAKGDGAVSKVLEDAFVFDDGVDMAYMGGGGKALMCSVYQIYAQLSKAGKIVSQALAYHLFQATTMLSEVVSRSLRECHGYSRANSPRVKSVLVAVGRLSKPIILGFSRLCHAQSGTQVQNQVLFGIVKMYQQLLEYFKGLCHLEAMANEGSHRVQRNSTVQASQSQGHTVLDTMTHSLGAWIEELDAIEEGHQMLLEGLAYVILEAVGSRLYLISFGHPREASIEAEIIASNISLGIGGDAQQTSQEVQQQMLDTAKIEAPYLIHLLNRLMRAAPAHFGAITANKASKSRQANVKAPTKAVLSVVAKERLQQTLMNCMFGTEGVGEDDPFRDCLQMPASTGRTIAKPKNKDVDVQDWYKEEVWRLLGWEMLSRDSDL